MSEGGPHAVTVHLAMSEASGPVLRTLPESKVLETIFRRLQVFCARVVHAHCYRIERGLLDANDPGGGKRQRLAWD